MSLDKKDDGSFTESVVEATAIYKFIACIFLTKDSALLHKQLLKHLHIIVTLHPSP